MNYSDYLWDYDTGLYKPKSYEMRDYIQITQDDPNKKTKKIDSPPLRRSARIRAKGIISDAKVKKEKNSK